MGFGRGCHLPHDLQISFAAGPLRSGLSVRAYPFGYGLFGVMVSVAREDHMSHLTQPAGDLRYEEVFEVVESPNLRNIALLYGDFNLLSFLS